MFQPSSRYFVLPDRIYTAPDGSQATYKARRFLPQPARLPLRGTVTVAAGDRLDLLAARALGASEMFWRLADANGAMAPFPLASPPGRKLRVPVPQAPSPVPTLED
jgi:hypothetical protein